MKVTNKQGFTFNITHGSEDLSKEDIEELKNKEIVFYYNELENTYRFFEFQVGYQWINADRRLRERDLISKVIPVSVYDFQQ